MLQQTRVATVIPYYERFLQRWPTVQDLAQASTDEVSAAWSGLGYYRRAKALHEAAGVIAREHGGRLPDRAETLRKLPGFGLYTSGAVASIAFDEPVAAVDGNVERVLARLVGLETDPKRKPAAQTIQRMAQQLSKGPDPGCLNQALIELGALVCKRPPTCQACPVRSECRAHRDGKTDRIPRPRTKKAPKTIELFAYLLEWEDALLLQRRPEGAPFAGLWSPVLFDSNDGSEFDSISIEAQDLQDCGSLTHLLTHRRLKTRVFRGALCQPPSGEALRLFAWDQLSALALPTFSTKVLRLAYDGLRPTFALPGRQSKQLELLGQAAKPDLTASGPDFKGLVRGADKGP